MTRRVLDTFTPAAAGVPPGYHVAPLPLELLDWLADLLVLRGVPLSYLVPHPDLLPPPGPDFLPALPNLDANTILRVVDRRTRGGPLAPIGCPVSGLTQLRQDLASPDLGVPVLAFAARKLALPRWHRPGTPVLHIEGHGRSFRHGHDGRMRADGRLPCRASGQTVTAIELGLDIPSAGARITGPRLLAFDPALARQPDFVRTLVHEAALLDPVNRDIAAGAWLAGIDPGERTQARADAASRAFADGSLDQLDDGLLGFFYRHPDNSWKLHVVPAIASDAWPPQQAVHAIVDRSTTLALTPGVGVNVILLLDGPAAFHVQAGLLPRKRIETSEVVPPRALAHLQSTLRVGPVVMDPVDRRVAAPALPGETWRWIERDVAAGYNDAPLAPFGQALGELPERPVTIRQGWLRLDPG